jgi:hypothetical protein
MQKQTYQTEETDKAHEILAAATKRIEKEARREAKRVAKKEESKSKTDEMNSPMYATKRKTTNVTEEKVTEENVSQEKVTKEKIKKPKRMQKALTKNQVLSNIILDKAAKRNEYARYKKTPVCEYRMNHTIPQSKIKQKYRQLGIKTVSKSVFSAIGELTYGNIKKTVNGEFIEASGICGVIERAINTMQAQGRKKIQTEDIIMAI